MEFCALASGSSGNCFFVKEGNDSILVDAGISAKRIVKELEKIKQKPESIKALFVTHEHIDHIRGIDVFSRNHKIPVYATKKTADFLSVNDDFLNIIRNNESIKIGKLNIQAFQKSHDGVDPVSYVMESKDKILPVITDIGFACKNVIEHVSCADSVILESNHDIEMLKNGPYPSFLKHRILSEKGHLSNYDAALLLLEHGKSKMKHIVLSHVSESNNTEELAFQTIKHLLEQRKDSKKMQIHISKRYEATPLLSI